MDVGVPWEADDDGVGDAAGDEDIPPESPLRGLGGNGMDGREMAAVWGVRDSGVLAPLLLLLLPSTDVDQGRGCP